MATATSKTIEKFIHYLTHGKLRDWEIMLDENGEFEIQDEKQEELKVNKSTFIEWWRKRWEASGWAEVEEPEMHIDVDTCSDCNKGCKVYLLEEGNFPYERVRESGQRLLRGLLIEENDGSITGIKGCSQFENRENPFGFEVVQSRVTELMHGKNYNYLTAFITASVEIYGKHDITVDYSFLMLCNEFDNQNRTE